MAHCFSQPGLLPFDQAKQIILDNVSAVFESEQLPIMAANNRILAKQVLSPVNVPPHDNSAMDGYAFAQASCEANQPFKLVGKSFAGAPFQGEVKLGECVRIMTGAKLPAGCDTVQMQENTQVDNELVSLTQPSKLGQNIRRLGEDIKASQVLMDKGYQLTSADIGTLASIGVATVEVMRPLKVALIATGDELKQPGEVLGDGDIYESNRFFLTSMLNKLPVEVIDYGVIADDKTLIRDAFLDANEKADVVLSSGGVSVGEADYTKLTIEEIGQVGFWKIAMKPGKPFAFGKLPNATFFGLPGNPVSALVTCYQLVIPALYQMMSAQMPARTQIKAISTTALKKSPGRMDFQRGIWQLNDQGQVEVISTGAQGSGILSSIAKANCFIVLAQQQGRVEAGEAVTIELFDELLS